MSGDGDFMSTLSAILANTYNADRDQRKSAEENLSKYWTLPNAFSGFLQLAAQNNGDIHVRMASALALKNKVRRFWSLQPEGKAPGDAPQQDYPPMTEEEKNYVKSTILETLMVETNNTLRKMFAEILRSISDYEFPDRWPALLPTLVSNIEGPDRLRVYNSLVALRKLIKRYEYKSGEKRAILYFIVQTTFPPIQTLLNNIREMDIIEAGSVMHMSIKIFWSATMYQLPPPEFTFDWNFWFQFLAFTLEKRLPEASEGLEPGGQPTAEDAREKWPWWKMKKWSSRCISHIMQRYGNPKHVASNNVEFAKTFRTHTSVSLLGPVMNTLASKSSGAFVTSAVRRYCLTYMASAVEMSPTYKLIKPHLHFVLFQVIFPTLFMPAEDEALMNSDPVEYVRRIHSASLDWLDHRHAASNLIERMAKLREGDVVPLVLNFVQSKLDEYQAATGTRKEHMHREKDAVLQIIGHIANTLVKSPAGSSEMEPFISNHVVPDFQSSCAFVRSRCCWVLEWFTKLDWNRFSPTTLQSILEGLMGRLSDPSLAVQNSAACALRTIIGCEPLKPHIRPIISQIVTAFFRIMTEVESESVLGALGKIVDIYSADVVPIMPMMVSNLSEQFSHYVAHDAEDDDASFAATNCIEAIQSIVQKLDNHRDCLGQVEVSTLPLLITVLSEERYFEYIDNVTSLMSMFTYMTDTVSPGMWRCAGLLMTAIDSWATDYLPECVVPLMNLMSKDIAGYYRVNEATGETLAKSLFDICETAINTDNSESEAEGRKACELLVNFLICSQALPAEVRSPLIAPVFKLVVNKLDAPEVSPENRDGYFRELADKGVTTSDGSKPLFGPLSIALRVRLYEVSMALLYCDVGSTLAVVNTDDASRARGKEWFHTLLHDVCEHIQSYTGSRVLCLAFAQVLRVPPAELPPFMREYRVSVLTQFLKEVDLMMAGGDDYYDPQVHDQHPRNRYNMASDIGGDFWGDSDDDYLVDEDYEDDDDNAGNGNGKSGAMGVPDGGYQEDADCVATEDDAYYKYLEQGRTDADLLDLGDRFIDDDVLEDNLQGMADYQLNAPSDSIDMTRYLLEVVNAPEGRLLGELRGSLDASCVGIFDNVLDVATRRVAAYQIVDPQQRAEVLKATERPSRNQALNS